MRRLGFFAFQALQTIHSMLLTCNITKLICFLSYLAPSCCHLFHCDSSYLTAIHLVIVKTDARACEFSQSLILYLSLFPLSTVFPCKWILCTHLDLYTLLVSSNSLKFKNQAERMLFSTGEITTLKTHETRQAENNKTKAELELGTFCWLFSAFVK